MVSGILAKNKSIIFINSFSIKMINKTHINVKYQLNIYILLINDQIDLKNNIFQIHQNDRILKRMYYPMFFVFELFLFSLPMF